MLALFLPIFLLFLMIGLPVFFGLLAAPGLLLWLNGQPRDLALLYRNVYNGMDSFPLMAIPFFMLAGVLMNRGGITARLWGISGEDWPTLTFSAQCSSQACLVLLSLILRQ